LEQFHGDYKKLIIVNGEMEKMDEIKFQELVMAQFDKMDQRFDKIDQRFEKIDQRFEKMDQRFDKIDQRFEKMDGELVSIKNKLVEHDGRFDRIDGNIDTIAIWVKHLVCNEDEVIDFYSKKKHKPLLGILGGQGEDGK
jgi:tetrahydromethanopterin S-methyltransferase subunit G